MDTEIRTIFEEALAPDQRVEQQLEQQRREIIARCAIAAAVSASGTRDPELLTLLLQREDLTVEDGQLRGLEQALERLRSLRPYLFQDGGDRPRFAAAALDRGLLAGEEQVAVKYRNNPWYKRRG